MEKEGEKSELERLHLRAEEVLTESLESTRRMGQMCQEARETATGVLVTLDGQGGELEANLKDFFASTLPLSQNVTEQLDNIEAGIDKMGADIKKAEQHLRDMTDNPIKRLFRRRR